jgi:ATP-dependent helicase/nuclease subunit A
VAVLQEAGRYIDALRPDASARKSIARSFRAVPELLQFVNDVCVEMAQPGVRPDEFTYTDRDRFPASDESVSRQGPAIGIAVAEQPEQCAAAVADEVVRILREETVRDRQTGVARQARPGDIALLFRSRASHREFERELELRAVPTYVYKGLGFFDADEIKDATALIRYLANPESNLRAAAFLRSRFVRLSDAALASLAPRIADSILHVETPAAMAQFDDEDRSVLAHLRAEVHGWLGLTDRVPPADLVEHILDASAYAFETRGARRAQAWENLKKMRGLVRRIQNRGYATLTRIADHIESLTAGDESNAVIEALDAVNLMTVHAAKGLEFPVVFVVNLAKGASGPPKPVRVIVDGEGGEPSVSVSPFVSETDEAERDRERQETRRLLYVAMTRARDRLYLSTTLKDGVMRPGPGSLGDVLPESVKALFSRAATQFNELDSVAWTGISGRSYQCRLCRAAAPAEATALSQLSTPVSDHFRNRADDTPATRVPVLKWLAPADTTPVADGVETSALAGTLVHRLLKRVLVSDLPVDETAAADLLTVEERASIPDPDALVHQAVTACARIRALPGIPELLQNGRVRFELPFSYKVDAALILRGAIDCVVERPDGSVMILEFKSGRPRASHEAQLDVYLRAARALFPGRSVDGRLVYAG